MSEDKLYQQMLEIERLGLCVWELRGQVKHWQSNHRHAEDRLRVLTQRPDLPKELWERLPVLEKLQAEKRELQFRVDKQRERINELEAQLKTCVCRRTKAEA